MSPVRAINWGQQGSEFGALVSGQWRGGVNDAPDALLASTGGADDSRRPSEHHRVIDGSVATH